MNGVHDMGGMQGYGAVITEPNEPLFHAPWERRALGLTLAMGATGQWNIDLSRSARETLPAATYLSSSYYRIWTLALEKLLLQRGLINSAELAAGHALAPAAKTLPVLRCAQVDAALARGSSTRRADLGVARFKLGDAVRAKNQHPTGHTRLPRYVRGHLGTVTQVHGCHVFADSHATLQSNGVADEAPHWLYTVAFEGTELWGDRAEPGVVVSVDAWEPYLLCAQVQPLT